jgi:RHS repeat-associated protein
MTYTSDGLLTSFTDPNRNTSRMSYDAMGLLVKDENAAGGFWALSGTRATETSTVSVTSALGRTTTYLTENLTTGDQRRTTTLPDRTSAVQLTKTDGTSQSTAPDSTVTTVVEGPDPIFGMLAPVAKSQTVDIPGTGLNFTSQTERTVTKGNPGHPLDLQTWSEKTTINSRIFTSTFDVSTSTFSRTSPVGRQTEEVLDTQGRVIELSMPGIETVQFNYDNRGRLASMVQGNRSTILSYDNSGNLASITDSLGRITSLNYDLAGRVLDQTFPDSRQVAFGYDANSNLTSLTPPGKPSHDFTYSPVDLRLDYTPPPILQGNSATSNAYNLDKELTVINRPNGTSITYGYDTAGKLSTATIGRGQYQFAYNSTTGQLERITSPGSITLTYTRAGFLLTGVSWTGTVAGSVGFVYNNDFKVTNQTVNGGNGVTFGYDSDGLLTGAGALTLTRNNQNGLLTGTVIGNVTDSFSYNTFGEVAQYQATYSGAPINTVVYTRDDLGRVTQKTETFDGFTHTYDYAYDLAGRLKQVKMDGVIVSEYSYDDNGNRLSLTTPAGAVSGAYDDQDRLLTYGNFTYTYSLSGELQSKTNTSNGQVTNYIYDELGNLISVTLPNGTVVEYVIDGQNRRIGKKVNGAIVQGFLYEGQLRPVAELDGSNNIVSRFVYAGKANVPEYMIRSGVTYRIITDHLGSPRLVVDVSSGSVVQRIDYDEFGNVTTDTNPGFQPFGFAGGLYDQQTKLTRFGARDYDAYVGRWTAKDPILFKGGTANLYEYVMNNPLKYIDPTGNEDICQNNPVNRTDPKGLENPFWEWFKHIFTGLTEPIPGSAVLVAGPATEAGIKVLESHEEMNDILRNNGLDDLYPDRRPGRGPGSSPPEISTSTSTATSPSQYR